MPPEIGSFETLKIYTRTPCNKQIMTRFPHKNIQREKQIREKYKVQNIIARILGKWQNRKYENDARKRQQAADANGYMPIWKYRKTLQNRSQIDKHNMLNNTDGAATKTIEERQQRWAVWIRTCFQTTPGNEIPDIMYIADEMETIPLQLHHIREESPLQQLTQKQPEVENG